MIIKRNIEAKILGSNIRNKVIIIAGARRTGKTFLLNELRKQMNEPVLFLNGEDLMTHELLSRPTLINYHNMLGEKRLLFIDEAQKIPDIGAKLKLMIDGIEGLKVIVTGSSAFDLTNAFGEPLTGRKFTYHLFPFAESEIAQIEDPVQRNEKLRNRLIFGNYPELTFMSDNNEKKEYLVEIVNSYLLKDILAYENLRASSKITELLKLLAFQSGSEVSINELAGSLGLNKKTVERYLDLLSKVFIISRLGGYSGNLRKEVSKSSKWYFVDNGIRNAIILNFASLEARNDIGRLWENYIISERIKFQNDKSHFSANYFWRTYDRQEIDWVESRDGKLFATEFKWKTEKVKVPAAWKQNYPDAEFSVITNENYFDWIT